MQDKAVRVVALQIAVTVTVSLLVLLRDGSALSALIGGAVGFIPAWIYARGMATAAGADPRRALRAQYRAEFYKFAATALLFALTFVLYRDVSAPVLFLTYLATLAVYWVALAMF
jgi:F0F1-type ATP synthase assembly protein I